MRAILTGCWCLNPCMLCGKNFIIQSTQLRNQSTWRTLQIALHPQPAVHGALSAQLAWKCSWHLFAAPEYETIRQAAAGVALYEYRRTSIPGKNRDEVEFHGHLLFTAQQITVGKGENIRFPYNSICQLNNFQHLIRAPNHHQFTTHPLLPISVLPFYGFLKYMYRVCKGTLTPINGRSYQKKMS